MQPVDGLGGRADRRVEAKRTLGAADIVIDRLGTQTTGRPFFQSSRRSQAAIAADGDQGVESAGLERGDQVVGAIDLALRASGPG